MIIQKLDTKYQTNETFYKLNEKAIFLESKLKDKENEYKTIILNRLNELFEVYKQKSNDPKVQSQLFILEIAIQELCMILNKSIKEI